jgi:hypothetical protein
METRGEERNSGDGNVRLVGMLSLGMSARDPWYGEVGELANDRRENTYSTALGSPTGFLIPARRILLAIRAHPA